MTAHKADGVVCVEARFFGSLTLRGEHRSALAYLPQQPFWALPRLIERGAVILRDPFTNKPYVHFYATKRVGGQVVNSEAIKLLKFI